jgi:hypothetical protein
MSTELLFLLGLALVIPIFFAQWSRRSEVRAFESERYLGGVPGVGVSVAFDGHRRWVELLFAEQTRGGGSMTVHVFLTPSEALLVSEWIRTAATPGRTLADAQRRRKGAHA